MKATIGRIVHYRLSDSDASLITQARARDAVVANSASAGDYYPAMVVRNFAGGTVNLQVFLDGPDSYWATSRANGDDEGQWIWPPHVTEAATHHEEQAETMATTTADYVAELPDAATHHPDAPATQPAGASSQGYTYTE